MGECQDVTVLELSSPEAEGWVVAFTDGLAKKVRGWMQV